MAFHVLIPEPVQKDMDKLDMSERLRVEKILQQLHEKGDEVGKPLAGLSFLREKKFNGKRLYYLVYSQWSAVLVSAISDKKAQQATISSIVSEASQHQIYVFDILKKKGII